MEPILYSAPIGLIAIILILREWRNSIALLILFAPISGVFSYVFHPSPLPILFKDIYIVLPGYLTYLLVRKSTPLPNIPPALLICAVLFCAIVILQMANPNLSSPLVALVGAKVWLLYLPLALLTAHAIRGEQDLVSLVRIMVVTAWIPCTVGLLQFVMTQFLGYGYTMGLFYGEAAAAATQQFIFFSLGGGILPRIPSTFTFFAQYFGFTLVMIAASLMLLLLETSRGWRLFAAITLALSVLAALLSGARAAFVFVPMFFLIFGMLEMRPARLIFGLTVLPLIALAFLAISGIDPGELAGMLWFQINLYGGEIVIGAPREAFETTIFGQGTGANTGAARRVAEDGAVIPSLESYYAKIIIELGVLGLISWLLFLASQVIYGMRAHYGLTDKRMRGAAAVITAFIILIAINGLKGWQLDHEPVTFYYWIFLGILIRLAWIEANWRLPSTGFHRPHHQTVPPAQPVDDI